MRLRTHRAAMLVAVATTLALIGGGCSDGAEDGTGSHDGGRSTNTQPEQPPGTGACDNTDTTDCLLPWPSDTLTRSDPSTATGRRLDLPVDGMPVNASGVPIDPTEWNRNDGFSPATIALTVIPQLDVRASSLPPQTDIAASLKRGSNLALVDLDTGKRVPAWAEIDSTVDDANRAPVRIVAARALTEGHRHAVGLWNLVHLDGTQVEPSQRFADIVTEPDPEQRKWLASLAELGGPVDQLDSAWSFTVASTGSLTGRLRHMWSETAQALQVDPTGPVTGGGAPPFTVDSADALGPVTVVQGSFQMPRYLTGDGGPGEVLDNGDDPGGLPEAHGSMAAPFTCVVPSAANVPVPFVIYGHGLLGSRSEVLDIGTLGATAGVGFCALDWIGMSASDIPTVMEVFGDLSRFRTVPDRLQQGHLAVMLMARLLTSSRGLATHEAFRTGDGQPLVNSSAVSLLGASQGGILGGPSIALSPDFSRATLAVGGMGYNLLPGRSVDFDKFTPVLAAGYPDELTQALNLELIEQLWDRGENAGWAQHITTDVFPEGGTTSTVLLLEAFGDHQVANVSTENLARTLDLPRIAPTLAEGRSKDVTPFFGIDPLDSLPHDGSALMVWDFGTPAPPVGNTPNRAGSDPHGALAGEPDALALLLGFVQPDGTIVDVCGGKPCTG